MVFDKFRSRREPFATEGLERLSPLEQEKALGQVGAREAEIIQAKKEKEAERSSKAVRKASQKGIRKLERREGVVGPRASLIKGEEKRRAVKAAARKVPLAKRIQAARPRDPRLGLRKLSLPFVRRSVLPETPNQRKIREAAERFRAKKINLGPDGETKSRVAQDALRDRINAATSASSPQIFCCLVCFRS